MFCEKIWTERSMLFWLKTNGVSSWSSVLLWRAHFCSRRVSKRGGAAASALALFAFDLLDKSHIKRAISHHTWLWPKLTSLSLLTFPDSPEQFWTKIEFSFGAVLWRKKKNRLPAFDTLCFGKDGKRRSSDFSLIQQFQRAKEQAKKLSEESWKGFKMDDDASLENWEENWSKQDSVLCAQRPAETRLELVAHWIENDSKILKRLFF